MVEAAKINPWFKRHFAGLDGGAAACAARLRGLRPLVDGGATPLVVLFGIIDCMKIGDRGLVTCAVVALYHSSGAYSVVYESRVVGGDWCVDGTHMKSFCVCKCVMDHPKIIAAVGRQLTHAEVGAMCVLAELTFACLPSGGVDYATCMKRACRQNRTMLDNIPIFGVFLAALVSCPRRYAQLDADWHRPQGGSKHGDGETTCICAEDSRFVKDDPRPRGQGEKLYKVKTRELGAGYVVIASGLSHADALARVKPTVTPVMAWYRGLFSDFDQSHYSHRVDITPAGVSKLHKVWPTWATVVAKSPPFHRGPTDPGPPGQPNPRFQGKGWGAERSRGVPHACAGTPVGAYFEKARAKGKVQNAKRDPDVPTCTPGAPMPPVRRPGQKRKRSDPLAKARAERKRKRKLKAERARARAAWRCETCGMSRDEVPSLVGRFCRRCYDCAREGRGSNRE